MARESINIEELLRVDAQDLLDSLSQENSRLRLELSALQSVVNRLTNTIRELVGNDEETSAE